MHAILTVVYLLRLTSSPFDDSLSKYECHPDPGVVFVKDKSNIFLCLTIAQEKTEQLVLLIFAELRD